MPQVLVLWVIAGVFGFVAGFAGYVIGVLFRAWLLRQKWAGWFRRWTLHGISAAVADEFRGYLTGEVIVAAELVDEFDEGKGKYVGPCACGCGIPVFYSGHGRPPRFVNEKHRGYHYGLRSSWQ